MLKLRMFGATNKGLVRALNQDAYTCDASRGLVVVSDGMGGHAAGEIASHMVVEGLSDALASVTQFTAQDLPLRIDETIQKVNTKIIMKSQEDVSCRGMGATVNVLCFAHGFVTIGHVGDSRTYLIRAFRTQDNKPRFAMWPLTIDHNLGTFIDRGILTTPNNTPESSLTARDRSKLTRGMGVMDDPKPDIYTRRIEVGDVFLTCSDGLHGFASDKDVLRTIVTGNLVEAPQRLIELAKSAGAPDNVTVVLSVVSDLEEPFREFNGPTYATRPYLLRLPNGEIQGPMTVSQIADQWIRRAIPGETEVAAGLGPWLLLRNKSMVLQVYTDFQTEPYSGYVYYESSIQTDYENAPATVSAPSAPAAKKPADKKPFLMLAAAGFAIASLALLIAIFMIDFESIVLPAY